jgi:geranylgeranyl pyrophosphate synthase
MSTALHESAADAGVAPMVTSLGFGEEMERLRAALGEWLAGTSAEMREVLDWQFVARSKYFRPLTLFACYRAVHGAPTPDLVVRDALVIELIHNVSLIIDDILDRSRHRRGKLTVHCRFGSLRALMTSGYITAEAYRLVSEDSQAVRLLSELLSRLGVAECLQWRLRQQPQGMEDWRIIAGEDTGSMFEVAASLGERGGRLRRFGGLLGILYHGCDDVGDVRGAEALGGGGHEDLRDGILTLPAAVAVRDPAVAAMFAHPREADRPAMAAAFEAALPHAERYLDRLAEEAVEEAMRFAAAPNPLLALIAHTRALSRR